MPEISRFAVVEPSAELADDVRVGPFSYIGPAVRIGPGCVIQSSVTVVGRTTLGQNNHVFPMAVIGAADRTPDDPGQVIIGDANAIREHVTIHAGRDKPTRIGNDNLIMIACQIGAGSTIGDHGIFANCTQVGSGACVEDYVRTSAFIVVRPGVKVGAYTFTLGYTEIDRDAPPFAMVQGSPFRVRGANTENLRRCGFGAGDIHALKGAFRELFNGTSDWVSEDALRELLAGAKGNPYVRQLAEAVRDAQGRKERP